MANHLFERKPLALLLEEAKGENRLRRVLGPVTLTSLGIGAIVGTGIFVLTGVAAHDKTGPALVLSFALAGIACIFAALCYAEFASMVPVAGSAYTYAYATLGELFAWIIGWDLVLEYAVASSAVAHGWSAHFQDLLGSVGVHLPAAISNAPFDFHPEDGSFVATGSWVDIVAIGIITTITAILVKGIEESACVNTIMVAVKLAVVLFVIVAGIFYINPENWKPFAPYGYAGFSLFGHTVFGQTSSTGAPLGVMAGAAIIFFAYIGFDSISTHAEEARRPQRDLPIGIISSLIVCTVLYIAVSAILTGMVPSDQINIDAPVADAFRRQGLPWAQRLIDIGAISGITSVLLVMMLSGPRVMLAIARDGLLPQNFFSAIHDKFRTPWKSTILVGVFVGILAGFVPLRILAELTNIGTLFAFVIVCTSVLIMRVTHPEAVRPFRVPFVPLVPILGIIFCLTLMFSLPEENWVRLAIWLGIGFVIYFGYGRRHSVLAKLRKDQRKR
ncbi:MAG: amino acid permease [Acidobacteriota bacterium]|jgi:APA family basic amino acid/polyamine antiporter|nr:amino acid permease [Acidobacteriota bacterium]